MIQIFTSFSLINVCQCGVGTNKHFLFLIIGKQHFTLTSFHVSSVLADEEKLLFFTFVSVFLLNILLHSIRCANSMDFLLFIVSGSADDWKKLTIFGLGGLKGCKIVFLSIIITLLSFTLFSTSVNFKIADFYFFSVLKKMLVSFRLSSQLGKDHQKKVSLLRRGLLLLLLC